MSNPDWHAELKRLADHLDHEYKTFSEAYKLDHKTAEAKVLEHLKHADKEVHNFVNGTPSVQVTPAVFAHALAIHDLVDDLYDDLIEKTQPPERPDIEP
jgi:hypothetical protein